MSARDRHRPWFGARRLAAPDHYFSTPTKYGAYVGGGAFAGWVDYKAPVAPMRGYLRGAILAHVRRAVFFDWCEMLGISPTLEQALQAGETDEEKARIMARFPAPPSDEHREFLDYCDRTISLAILGRSLTAALPPIKINLAPPAESFEQVPGRRYLSPSFEEPRGMCSDCNNPRDYCTCPKVPPARPKCTNYCPADYTDHWREWHRGHGCELDPS